MPTKAPYSPGPEILNKYADLLVNYALNSGDGLKPGEVVQISVPECAKPIYVPLRNAVLAAGGHPIMHFLPDDVEQADYYRLANEAQLKYFPKAYFKGIVDASDHSIMMLAEANKHELEGVDPRRLMMRSSAFKLYREWRQTKEANGKFTWTLGLYGTEAMAKEVGMTIQEYWEQIISACFLDQPDPKIAWIEVTNQILDIKDRLNTLKVKRFHLTGPDADLWIGCGPRRQWLGGGGRNIPSFELFISPDWRGTEGWIKFNQPLYYAGSLIEGVELAFLKGHVVKSTATKNPDLLREMLKVENANKIGEFSLTDGRYSRITRFMGETLYDENMGGKEGNTHIAVGNAYLDSYPGNASVVTPEEWIDWGYNQSAVHTDIVSTTSRKVEAELEDGTLKLIYESGQFKV